MNIPDELIADIEEKIREISELDPADVPEPASELAEMLGAILDEADPT